VSAKSEKLMNMKNKRSPELGNDDLTHGRDRLGSKMIDKARTLSLTI
jgi:hypothetical protein